MVTLRPSVQTATPGRLQKRCWRNLPFNNHLELGVFQSHSHSLDGLIAVAKKTLVKHVGRPPQVDLHGEQMRLAIWRDCRCPKGIRFLNEASFLPTPLERY